MTSETDLSQFWCWNKECLDYGKKDQGNIVIKQRYGKDNRSLLKCRTCKDYFSETRGIMFLGLDTPQEEVLRTLVLIPEKGSICGVARATGHDKDTVSKWLGIVGTHCEKVTKYFLQKRRCEPSNQL